VLADDGDKYIVHRVEGVMDDLALEIDLIGERPSGDGGVTLFADELLSRLDQGGAHRRTLSASSTLRNHLGSNQSYLRRAGVPRC